MVFMGDSLYSGSEKIPSSIYRVSADMVWMDKEAGDAPCYGVFSCEGRIWGAFCGKNESLGTIKIFSPELVLQAEYALPPGFGCPNEIVFGPEGEYYYVACWQAPAGLVKITVLNCSKWDHCQSVQTTTHFLKTGPVSLFWKKNTYIDDSNR